MRTSKKHRRFGVAEVAVLVLAVLVAAAWFFELRDSNNQAAEATSGSRAAVPSTTPTAEAVVQQRQPQAAVELLEKSARPFTISVIGDSTGAIDDNWVRQTAKWMSETYDRPVELHQWSVRVTPNAYQPTEVIGNGKGAPIVIWNGSAEGMGIDYSTANWAKLVPVKPTSIDLAFINHGHNVAAGELTREGGGLLDQVAAQMQRAAVVVIGQNPQLEVGGTLGPAQESNVRDWMAYAKSRGFATVDVLDVFLDYGDYSKLLIGSVHPNAKGFKLWSDAVIATLSAG